MPASSSQEAPAPYLSEAPPMKRASLMLFALLLTMTAASCQDDGVAGPDSLAVPEPSIVEATAIEAPVKRMPDHTETATYYLIFGGPYAANAGHAFPEDPEAVLKRVLEQGFAPLDAWHPVEASIQVPCGAPNVYSALVVRLAAPNPEMEEMGFVANPAALRPPPNLNCGVEQFKHYAFAKE